MTKHEETARRILPCKCGYEPDAFDTIVPAIASGEHQTWCQANRRPAVAAALSQAEAEGRRDEMLQMWGEDKSEITAAHDAEIARLKAENLRLSHEGLLVEKQAAEAERDYFRTKLAEAERERDAAEAKGVRMGLERARELSLPWTKCRCDSAYTDRGRHESNAPHEYADEIVAGIDAEIAKAEGKSPA